MSLAKSFFCLFSWGSWKKKWDGRGGEKPEIKKGRKEGKEGRKGRKGKEGRKEGRKELPEKKNEGAVCEHDVVERE